MFVYMMLCVKSGVGNSYAWTWCVLSILWALVCIALYLLYNLTVGDKYNRSHQLTQEIFKRPVCNNPGQLSRIVSNLLVNKNKIYYRDNAAKSPEELDFAPHYHTFLETLRRVKRHFETAHNAINILPNLQLWFFAMDNPHSDCTLHSVENGKYMLFQ